MSVMNAASSTAVQQYTYHHDMCRAHVVHLSMFTMLHFGHISYPLLPQQPGVIRVIDAVVVIRCRQVFPLSHVFKPQTGYSLNESREEACCLLDPAAPGRPL